MADSQKQQPVAITEDEAALYDRQIRLWGLEAQERMRNATILVVNLKGVAAETIKNIVLSGIGTLILYDPEHVTEEDLGAGFLYRENDVGKKRVDSARPNIQSLNPLVSVQTLSDPDAVSGSSLQELLQRVDLLCVTDSSRKEMLRYNDACRKTNTLFYAGGTYGLLGFIFVDLLNHEHIVPDRATASASSQPKMVKETVRYPSLDAASNSLKTTFSKLTKRQTKDVNPVTLFSILAIWEYQDRKSSLPMITDGQSDSTDEVEAIANELIKSANVNTQILQSLPKSNAQSIAQTASHEFSPVCAVVGGLLAQDILKALAGREPPYANFLVFDGVAGGGNVARLGLS